MPKLNRDRAQDELVRRMGEPKYLRDLRHQHERIQAEKARALDDFFHQSEARDLRREIRESGEEPCA